MSTLKLTSNRVPKKKLFAAPIPLVKANPVKQKPKPQPLPVVVKPLLNLEELSPVFVQQLPLAVGVHKQLYETFPELSKKSIREALENHVHSYRWKLKPGMARYNLDGSLAGLVTEAECQLYIDKLNGASEAL